MDFNPLICRLPVLKSLVEMSKILSVLSVSFLLSASVTMNIEFPMSVLKISFHEYTTA